MGLGTCRTLHLEVRIVNVQFAAGRASNVTMEFRNVHPSDTIEVESAVPIYGNGGLHVFSDGVGWMTLAPGIAATRILAFADANPAESSTQWDSLGVLYKFPGDARELHCRLEGDGLPASRAGAQS